MLAIICNVYANTSVAFIEKLALWDGPALLMLIAAWLSWRLNWSVRCVGDLSTNQSPMVISTGRLSNSSFHCCSSSLKYRCSYIMLQLSVSNEGMLIAVGVSSSLWSASSGATL